MPLYDDLGTRMKTFIWKTKRENINEKKEK